MRKIDEIIVHCSATHPGWRRGETGEQRLEEIRRWHTEECGWSDIGYHWVIDRDGTERIGRRVGIPGAHCSQRNAHSIGICLVGGAGSEADDTFLDHYTPAQDAALRRLIASLQRQYRSITKITGHNQHAAKACPGFSVPRWLKRRPPSSTMDSAKDKTKRAIRDGGPLGAAGGFSVAGIAAALGGWDGYAQLAVIVMVGAFGAAFLYIQLKAKDDD